MTGSNASLTILDSTGADRILAAVREATATLTEVVDRFTETDLAAPSLLPGWTRGHVVTHLARNADALVNLLTWARTGIEHTAYPSRADRDADIEAGAGRLSQVQREDLSAACARFMVEAERLDADAWAARITHVRPMTAVEIPQARLFEVWTHLVDLDAGVTFDAIPSHHLELVVDRATRPYERPDGPTRVVAEFPDGSHRTWALAIDSSTSELAGPATAVLSWLTNRGPGLPGAPDLGAWG